MTDNEIIKALESLLDKMRAYESEQASIGRGLVEDIISMYNRQKAEIDGLIAAQETLQKYIVEKNAEIERLQIRNKTLTEITKNYDWKFSKAKTEAIKEFAERLKTYCAIDRGFAVMPDDVIDNLAKEMTDIDVSQMFANVKKLEPMPNFECSLTRNMFQDCRLLSDDEVKQIFNKYYNKTNSKRNDGGKV